MPPIDAPGHCDFGPGQRWARQPSADVQQIRMRVAQLDRIFQAREFSRNHVQQHHQLGPHRAVQFYL
jgi:hypothetical protein